MAPTIDSVKIFSEYTHLCPALVYQYTRAPGFPKIQTVNKGKIMILREAALEWLENLGRQNGRYDNAIHGQGQCCI